MQQTGLEDGMSDGEEYGTTEELKEDDDRCSSGDFPKRQHGLDSYEWLERISGQVQDSGSEGEVVPSAEYSQYQRRK